MGLYMGQGKRTARDLTKGEVGGRVRLKQSSLGSAGEGQWSWRLVNTTWAGFLTYPVMGSPTVRGGAQEPVVAAEESFGSSSFFTLYRQGKIEPNSPA